MLHQKKVLRENMRNMTYHKEKNNHGNKINIQILQKLAAKSDRASLGLCHYDSVEIIGL